MKTVLVSGANGFIGWYLVRDLLANGFRVIATGKGPSRLAVDCANFQYETLNFTDRAEVNAVVERFTPDALIHAGAMGRPVECEMNRDAALRTNVTGTDYLLEAAAAHRCHFVFISTDFVFDGTSLGYTEADAFGPVNYYGHTKAWAEAAVNRYPFDWSIVRTILVYGKPMTGRENLLTIVADKLRNGETYQVFSDQTRMPTYVEDLSAGIVTIVQKQATGIYHLSGNDVLTPYQMALELANHFDFDGNRIVEVTSATFKQPALRPPKTGFDLSKAKTELGYVPTPFKDGLRKMFDFDPRFPVG